jgi:hypothetical protein
MKQETNKQEKQEREKKQKNFCISLDKQQTKMLYMNRRQEIMRNKQDTITLTNKRKKETIYIDIFISERNNLSYEYNIYLHDRIYREILSTRIYKIMQKLYNRGYIHDTIQG